MKISTDSWHYRLYVFMSQWNAAWRHKSDYLDYPPGSKMIGLCPYMRMILIWGPLAIFSNLIPIFAVIGALFMFPMELNGALGVAWLFGWIGAIIGLIVLAVFLVNFLEKRKELRQESQVEKQHEEYEKPKTFWSLLKDFLLAIKTRICPVLEVNDDRS